MLTRPRNTIAVTRVIVLAALLAFVAATRPAAGNPSPPPPKYASSPIAVTADGTVLLVVNPDSNSITLVDALDHTVTAEIAVGADPRSVAVAPGDVTAYVANHASGSLSVIDIAGATVRKHVPVGNRPSSVVVSPDGRLVIVAETGDDQVRFLDAERLVTISVLPVGDRPAGLAVTPDGGRLLVTHLLSGTVTILDIQPYSLRFPFVARLSPLHQAAVAVDKNPASRTGQAIATWPNIAPAPAVVVNTTGSRAYLPQTMANGLGLNTRFDTTVFPKVSVIDLEANRHQTAEHISLPETDRPVGLPWDAALARNDTEIWVVNAASNDVSVVDIGVPTQPGRVANIPVGDGPRGIVISPDQNTAYVNNSLSGTVSVIDTNAYTVTSVIPVTDIPLPPLLLHGKRLFHSSARSDLAQAGWISCNTCHVEGEHDGRTWLLQYTGVALGGAESVATTLTITRNTTSLLGMIETYPLRWSAEWDESADSEFSIRFEQFGSGLIEGDMHPTLGDPNQGRAGDLDSLAAFIDSLAVPSRTHTLTPSEQRGKAIFESPQTGCAVCHPAPLYTDLQVHDVGTASAHGEWFGPLIDTPSLRFLYDSAPYLHDGSAPTLLYVLTTANPAGRHGVTSHLTPGELSDLVDFLLALPYSE